MHQFQLDGPGEVGGLGLIAQGGAGLGEQQQRLAGLALVEQRIDQHLQVIRPLGQRARPSQLDRPAAESLDEAHNRPSNCPRAPSSASSGQCSPSRRAVAGQLRRCSEAQQQAVQPRRRKGRFGRQAHVRAARHRGPSARRPRAASHAAAAGSLDAGAAGDGRLFAVRGFPRRRNGSAPATAVRGRPRSTAPRRAGYGRRGCRNPRLPSRGANTASMKGA